MLNQCLLSLLNTGLQVQAEEPSPLSLPRWLKAESESGRLKIEYYEPGTQRAFPGWTTFEFRFEFQYDTEIVWPRKKPSRGKVILAPTFTKLDVPVTHRVELPKFLKSDKWYQAVLSRHELEHVRVGSHPRLVLLGKHLMRKVRRIERTVERPEDVTREWVRKQIDEELTPRKDAIYKLVMDINAGIDKTTEHGAIALPDREHFFADLYLKENLDAMKFPYLSEVLDLINTREYLEARVQTVEIDEKP